MISFKQRKENGFTIVELMIVIVVIGVLGGLLIATYGGIQEKDRNNERQTDLKLFQRQLEVYFSTSGYYPDTADLGSNSSHNVTFVQTYMKDLDKENIRDPKAPTGDYSLSNKDEAVAHEYSYYPTDDAGSPTCLDGTSDPCTHYKLFAKLEDNSGTYELSSLY